MNKRWIVVLAMGTYLPAWSRTTAVAVDNLQPQGLRSAETVVLPADRECVLFNRFPRLADMRDRPVNPHPGHVHTPPAQKPNAQDKLRLPVLVRQADAENGRHNVEIRLGGQAVLSALARHHALVPEKIRIEVLRFTGASSSLGYPPLGGPGALTLRPADLSRAVLTFNATIGAAPFHTNRWAIVLVATAAGHEFESPQIRCIVTAEPVKP